MPTIELDLNPSELDDKIVRDGLSHFNEKHMVEKATHFSLYLKDDNGAIRGGALVWAHTDALYIDTLWIDKTYRHQQYGSEILATIEQYARDHNIDTLFVDTLAFQATAFYEKQGYHQIGNAPGYFHGHDRIFYKKRIQ